jgi:hypothetical protein
MKRLLYLFVITGAMQATAQPVIQNMDKMSTGDNYTYVNCTATGIAPGPDGASNHWMFDGLAGIDSTKFSVLSPGATPFAADFSSANVAVVSSKSQFLYYNVTSTNNFFNGFVDTSLALKTVYSNTLLSAKRPVSYTDTLTDTFTSAITGPVTASGGGYVQIVADAYGMLHLPDANYLNVLRVRTAITEKDSAVVGPATVYFNTRRIMYQWYSNDFNNPLLIWDSTSITGGTTSTQKNVSYLVDKNMSVTDKTSAHTKCTGNLSGNTLVLTGDFVQATNYNVSLFNSNGQKVYAVNFVAKANTQTLDTGIELPAGVYVAAVISAGNVQTVKLIKQ